MGFIDYVNHAKIECAKEMLDEGTLKIYEISDKLGYESAFYFSRVFKRWRACRRATISTGLEGTSFFCPC